MSLHYSVMAELPLPLSMLDLLSFIGVPLSQWLMITYHLVPPVGAPGGVAVVCAAPAAVLCVGCGVWGVGCGVCASCVHQTVFTGSSVYQRPCPVISLSLCCCYSFTLACSLCCCLYDDMSCCVLCGGGVCCYTGIIVPEA